MTITALIQHLKATSNKKVAALVIMSACLLYSCGPSKEQGRNNASSVSLRIHAAAGTRLATEDICNLFEKQHTVTIERNYASSGTLARQLASGAGGDVFISANRQWIDFLNDKRLLKGNSIHAIAGNSLVIIAPKDTPAKSIQFTPDFAVEKLAEHIAVGDPAYVPVGKYTNEVFQHLGWSNKLAGKLVLAKDVSSVLNYVALGECQLGVVYRTEAKASGKVNIVAEVPVQFHQPIVFFVATLNNGQSPLTASKLAAFFTTEGKDIFKGFGFSLPD